MSGPVSRRHVRDRIRNHAVLLAITLWAVVGVNLAWPGVLGFSGHLKGEDYAHFYVLGRIVRDGRLELLYDTPGQAAYLSSVIPGAPLTYFVPVYGPQVALFFRLFASFPYLVSFGLWTAATIVLYLSCCYAIWQRCGALREFRTEVLILAIGSPALWQLVVYGQNSAIALAALTFGWILLRAQRPALAGLVLGVLFYKPQLALAAVVVLLATSQWRALAMVAASAIAQMLLPICLLGSAPPLDYLRTLLHLGEITALLEPKPYQMHSFRALFTLLGSSPFLATVLSIGCAAGTMIVVVRHWRIGGDPLISFALLLLATVLISPHTTVYDLVIIAPALMILADRLLSATVSGPATSALWVIVGALFLLPLGSHYSRFVHIQPSVICMTALLWWQARGGRLLRSFA